MADIVIAGIMRSGAFSPNHIGNDATIFNMVADQLRKRGCMVNIYSEEQFLKTDVPERVIVNMCRQPDAVEKLQALEDSGRLVINSGYGIENCIRERLARIFVGEHIPYPASITVNTNESVRDELKRAGIGRCWVKRGDFHTLHKEDITFVRSADNVQEVLQEYFLRGFRKAVINEHIEGDLVKFYGVRDTTFFNCFYPFDSHVSGADESVNGKPRQLGFDRAALADICSRAAEALDLQIYGGECVVAEDGSITIIDFNDWPTFGPCRNEAAPVIARRIIALAKKHEK